MAIDIRWWGRAETEERRTIVWFRGGLVTVCNAERKSLEAVRPEVFPAKSKYFAKIAYSKIPVSTSLTRIVRLAVEGIRLSHDKPGGSFILTVTTLDSTSHTETG